MLTLKGSRLGEHFFSHKEFLYEVAQASVKAVDSTQHKKTTFLSYLQRFVHETTGLTIISLILVSGDPNAV